MKRIGDFHQRRILQFCAFSISCFSIYSILLHYQFHPDHEPQFQTKPIQSQFILNNTEYDSLYKEIQGRVAHQRQKCSEAMKKTVDQSELEIPQFVKERLIVDETRKMIYCPIPKAGSSNWKRIFIKLTHPEYEDTEDLLDIRGVHHIELPTLDSFSEDKQEKVLKEYRKFIWVRHPFERILSAFRNKLEHPFTPEFQLRYGRKIIKQFRPMASQESLKNGADVSITEFIKYIINTEPLKFNNHWMRYWDLCAPCHVDYDFIGTAENYSKEAELFVRQANISVTFPEHEQKTTRESSLEILGGLTESYLTKLYRVYQPDFIIFNYTIENFLAEVKKYSQTAF